MDKPEFRCGMCGQMVSAESTERLATKVRQHLKDKHQQDMSQEQAEKMIAEAEKEHQRPR